MITLNNHLDSYDVQLGFDVDSKSYAFTVRTKDKRSFSKKIAANPQAVVHYLHKNFYGKKVLCSYEAGGSGYLFHDTLVANNIDCIVLAPNSIPKPGNCTVKNNRIDSRRILDALHSQDTSSIRVPSHEFRELRHLIRIYDNYAKFQKASKQRIKGLLLFESLNNIISEKASSRWTRKFIKELEFLVCSSSTRARLHALLSDLQYSRTHLAESLKEIKKYIYQNKNMRSYIDLLTSIPGIGIRTASYVLGKIGDPQFLQSPDEIGAFFGLVPKER